MVRRVLADELDPDSPFCRSLLSRSGRPATGSPPTVASPTTPTAHAVRPQTPAPATPRRPGVRPPAPGSVAPPGREPPDPEPSREEGWWAAADRAVDAASRALLELEGATGHAGRLVRAAAAADADDEDDLAGRRRPVHPRRPTPWRCSRGCTDTQRAQLADLLAASGGGGLVERPRIALTDAVTGALLALTDLPELRRTAHCGARACRRHPAGCTHDLTGRPGLGPPGPTDGYRPAARLDRFLRARDRRCRQPGCRRPVPRGGELDHNRPYPLGPTSAANLTGYCTGHHRGKHQAPGWQHTCAPTAPSPSPPPPA